jgi:hypothetical protein
MAERLRSGQAGSETCCYWWHSGLPVSEAAVMLQKRRQLCALIDGEFKRKWKD